MSRPQIWNIEKEKEGNRPAKVSEKKKKKRPRVRATDKKTKETFFVGRTT